MKRLFYRVNMKYFLNDNGSLWHTDYEVFIDQWNRGLHPEWKRISRARYRQLKRLQRISEGVLKALAHDNATRGEVVGGTE